MLWFTLVDAGLAPCHARPRPALRTLAQRWLVGELDAAVDVPVAVVCGVLNLDAGALAARPGGRVGSGSCARSSSRLVALSLPRGPHCASTTSRSVKSGVRDYESVRARSRRARLAAALDAETLAAQSFPQGRCGDRLRHVSVV